jgi:hypothetical protein
MRLRAAQWFLLFILAAILAGSGGCATEPENASVRPWNAPQGWESNLPVDMGQHD